MTSLQCAIHPTLCRHDESTVRHSDDIVPTWPVYSAPFRRHCADMTSLQSAIQTTLCRHDESTVRHSDKIVPIWRVYSASFSRHCADMMGFQRGKQSMCTQGGNTAFILIHRGMKKSLKYWKIKLFCICYKCQLKAWVGFRFRFSTDGRFLCLVFKKRKTFKNIFKHFCESRIRLQPNTCDACKMNGLETNKDKSLPFFLNINTNCRICKWRIRNKTTKKTKGEFVLN